MKKQAINRNFLRWRAAERTMTPGVRSSHFAFVHGCGSDNPWIAFRKIGWSRFRFQTLAIQRLSLNRSECLTIEGSGESWERFRGRIRPPWPRVGFEGLSKSVCLDPEVIGAPQAGECLSNCCWRRVQKQSSHAVRNSGLSQSAHFPVSGAAFSLVYPRQSR